MPRKHAGTPSRFFRPPIVSADPSIVSQQTAGGAFGLVTAAIAWYVGMSTIPPYPARLRKSSGQANSRSQLFPLASCRQLAHARHFVLCPPHRRHVEEGLKRSGSAASTRPAASTRFRFHRTGLGWPRSSRPTLLLFFGIVSRMDLQSSRILSVVPVPLIILTSICSSLALAPRLRSEVCKGSVPDVQTSSFESAHAHERAVYGTETPQKSRRRTKTLRLFFARRVLAVEAHS